jgi:predicted dehydrogenase
MRKGKVRIGIIGCGGIANGFHLRDLSQIPEAEVVAYADINIRSAEETAKRWKKHWRKYFVTDDYKKLLEQDLDAVIVATYHETHAKIAADALRAGKHVLVQKPLTTRMEDADELVEVANEHRDLKVQCLPYNWTEVYKEAKRLIDDGAIGRPCQARRRIAHSGPARDSWFYNPDIAKFGASFDMGVYAVSGITGLLGPAVSVSGLVGTFEEGVRIDDNATWQLKFENGAFGTAETSWTQLVSVEPTIVYGTDGVLLLDSFMDPLRVFKRTSGVSFSSRGRWYVPMLPEDPPAAPHRHFIDCILKDERPLGTPEHARHVVEIMLAAHESNRTGKRVELRTRF